jgi:flagellar biosynthesis protein FlhB
VSGERTEAATPRRKEQMRGEGKAPRSPELGTSIGLMAACVILQATAAGASTRITTLLTGSFTSLGTSRTQNLDLLWGEQVLGRAGEAWLMSIAPLLLILPVLGIGIGYAQGGIFSFKGMLHFSALNPAGGVKRLFSMQAVVGLIRSLAKVALVGALTWRALLDTAAKLPEIDGTTDPRLMAAFLGQAMMNVVIPAAELLMLLAVVDYAYQRWNFAKSARMSLQDVKQEHKQQDGDPMVKAQIRAKQRQMARAKRQMNDVPDATVIVTNPTHIAIALKYDRGMSSPKILAKGSDLLAERIKQIAREANIPLVENVMLARGLFKAVEVGDEIPMELYQAVAEVLAYVYSLKRRRAAAAARR